MDEIRESKRKTQQEIEDLENADGSEKEIEKLEGKLRTLKSENIKPHSKYKKSFQSEKEEAPLKESTQVLETLRDEKLAEEEEVDASEVFKAIKKRKDDLNRRITLEMFKASDPSEKNPERKKQAADKRNLCNNNCIGRRKRISEKSLVYTNFPCNKKWKHLKKKEQIWRERMKKTGRLSAIRIPRMTTELRQKSCAA